MRIHAVFFLILLAGLSACSPAATVPPTATTAPTASLEPVNTITVTPSATPLPTSTPPPTMAPSPTALPSPTPIPSPSVEPSPTPACWTVFNPAGFSADGSQLIGLLTVEGGPGTRLQVLDLPAQRGVPARTVLQNPEIIQYAALSPDGQTLAWALPDFRIQLVRVADGKILATLSGHTAVINALRFSPDGSLLYSASSDHSVMVWNVQKRSRQSVFQPKFAPYDNTAEVLGLGISPDGKTLVTLPFDGQVQAWDTQTFEKTATYSGAIAGAYSGADARYSADGKYLAISLVSGPGAMSLWRVSDGAQLWSGGMMMGFDFSPDGKHFAHTEAGAEGRSTIVIRSADGQVLEQTIVPGWEFMIWKMLFSPDSKTLVSTAANILSFWNVSDGSLQSAYTAPCP